MLRVQTAWLIGGFILFTSVARAVDMEGQPISAVGRNSKLTLIRDLHVVANGVNIHIDGSYEVATPGDVMPQASTCALVLKEPSPKSRILSVGKEIVFTGEFESGPVAGLKISKPAAFDKLICGSSIKRILELRSTLRIFFNLELTEPEEIPLL